VTDLELIRTVLKQCRKHAKQFEYGGLGWLLKDLDAALEALDRIEQPSFLEGM